MEIILMFSIWRVSLAHDNYYVRIEALPYLCTKNETMAPLHVATLTVQRELPKYEIIFSI